MSTRWLVYVPLAAGVACNDAPVESSSASATDGTSETSSGTPSATVSDSDDAHSTTGDPAESGSPTTEGATSSDSTTATSSSSASESSSSSTTAVESSSTDEESTSPGEETSSSSNGSSETSGTDASTATTDSSESSGDTVSTGTSSTETGGGAVCGNGIVEDGEFCDDENLVGGDGCEADCSSSDDVQPIWELEQGGPFGFSDCGGGVAFDGEDNLILAGIWNDQIWVGKYDTSYSQIWEVTYPAVSGAGACMEVRVAVDAADNVAVIGPQDAMGFYDVFVAKLDPDGAEQWTQTFAGAFNNTDNAGDIAFDLEGNLLLAGELRTTEEYITFWVAKLTPDGGFLWSEEHVGAAAASINGARGVAADPDGNVWGVGYETPQLFETDISMRRYDPDGEILATELIVGVDASSQDIAYDVALDGLGDRIVVGTYRVDAGVDDNDAWMRRYVGGVEQWMTTFEGTGPAEDFAVGVALAADGTIVTSGVMYDAPGDGLRNRWLAKLSADGTLLWERRYPHESTSEAWRTVAVASDGRIAVAGSASFAFPWSGEARYAVYPP